MNSGEEKNKKKSKDISNKQIDNSNSENSDDNHKKKKVCGHVRFITPEENLIL